MSIIHSVELFLNEMKYLLYYCICQLNERDNDTTLLSLPVTHKERIKTINTDTQKAVRHKKKIIDQQKYSNK